MHQPSAADSNCILVKAVPTLEKLAGLREMGRDAICWQLSSAKPGNGVEQIRDGNLESYWQSDGNSQPHWIQVHFGRRVAISHVCLYLDFSLDESYTPRRVQVQVGMTNQDLIPALYPPTVQIEFSDPVGWCIIPITSPPDPLDGCFEGDLYGGGGRRGTAELGVRAHLIRISILSMHQNGRDTHVRQVHLYGPRMHSTTAGGAASGLGGHQPLSSIANRRESSADVSRDGAEDPEGDADDDEGHGEPSSHSPTYRQAMPRQGWDDFGTAGLSQFSSIR